MLYKNNMLNIFYMFYMLYSKYFFKYLFINYEINLNIKLRNQSIFIKKIKKLILLKLKI